MSISCRQKNKKCRHIANALTLAVILTKLSSMNQLPNFDIKSDREISTEFLRRNILTFHQATEYIQNLSYGRNLNKDNLKTIFTHNKGTCSTKHAILKQLANENNFNSFKLTLGIFKMSADNTPKVANTLTKHNLEYIPEAHNYLKYEN